MTEKPFFWRFGNRKKKLHTPLSWKKGKMARIPNKKPMGHTACLKNTATNKLNKTMILPARCWK